MRVTTHDDLARLRQSVKRTRRLSDRIVGFGPFGLGLDGVLGWIPGAGAVYSVAAGALLLVQARRARASKATFARMAGLLATDTLSNVVPIPFAPAIADMVFTGHKWAADALLKEMERTLYYPGGRDEAERDPEFRRRVETEQPERIVFLAD